MVEGTGPPRTVPSGLQRALEVQCSRTCRCELLARGQVLLRFLAVFIGSCELGDRIVVFGLAFLGLGVGFDGDAHRFELPGNCSFCKLDGFCLEWIFRASAAASGSEGEDVVSVIRGYLGGEVFDRFLGKLGIIGKPKLFPLRLDLAGEVIADILRAGLVEGMGFGFVDGVAGLVGLGHGEDDVLDGDFAGRQLRFLSDGGWLVV